MMIRGFMKTTSVTALVAAAGILMGNSAYAPAQAADLGDGCCTDLEARVAELEATTARKGNRVVSLQIYGQVNKALLIWDDGDESDAYVVDNDVSGTRIGFKGSATLRPGWTAGYRIELDIQDAASDGVSNGSPGDDPSDQIGIRHSYLYFESSSFGRFTIGQTGSATDGINEIVLAGSLRDVGLGWNDSFFIRTESGALSAITWSSVADGLDGGRNDVILYDSPSIHGFILSAAWGDDDIADVALRFSREWNSIRLAAGIGYQWLDNSSDESEIISGSFSVMHIPTGLYVAFAAGTQDYDDLAYDPSFWYLQGGVERRWLSHGSTTLYGEYGYYEDFAGVGNEVDRWGFGVVQRFDSAALEIYAQAAFWDFEDASTTSYDDLSQFLIGSRIKF